MKSTIYNAPDGFFENFETEIKDRTASIRTRRRIAGIGAFSAIVALMLVLPFGQWNGRGQAADSDAALAEDEELLNTYEYDIFLNTYQL